MLIHFVIRLNWKIVFDMDSIWNKVMYVTCKYHATYLDMELHGSVAFMDMISFND
jgi:hypothetical protein